MKQRIVSHFILLGVLASNFACAGEGPRTSTPEETLERFVEGYRRADEEMVNSTFHESGGIAPISPGREETYKILEKLLVVTSSDVTSKPGDIHFRVMRQIKYETEYFPLLAYFRLREINKNDWKIVGYAADESDRP